MRTARIKRPRMHICWTSIIFTENSDRVVIRSAMIPGLSWPETRIKPVNCEIFSLGIGSDYPLLALSEVSFILMSAILNLEEISVRRGDKTILGPLSWQVLEGQRWVVLGPNGAGKTTLLQICASLIHPTTGKIEILGQQLGKVDVF